MHLNFIWTLSSPIDHSSPQKTRDTGLPNGEYHVALRSIVLTQYRNVMDRWPDGFAVAYAALAKLALWRTVTFDFDS